ncbi:hypothetical protein NDK25_24340 [Niallia taxi]|nr:hypothetical protein [Niallia taxi]MDE5055351.1 hypothetical protein [Niallia taxi]
MIYKCPQCSSFAYSDSKCGSCGYRSPGRRSIDALYKTSPKASSKPKPLITPATSIIRSEVTPYNDNSSCYDHDNNTDSSNSYSFLVNNSSNSASDGDF